MQMLNIQNEVKSPRVKSLCFHRSRPVLILALHNGEIRAYDYTLCSFIYKFLDHEGPVRSVSFHPTNDIFVGGGDNQFVRIWNYNTRGCTKLNGHADYIRCVRFHNTEPLLLSASDDRTVKIWNFQSKKKVNTLAGHTNYVMSADRWVVSVSLDQTIRVWNIYDGTSEIVEAHDKGINTVYVLSSLNYFMIFTGSDDRTIKVFKNDLINTDTLNYHNKGVTALLAFDNTVVSCGEDGLLFLNENKKTRREEREGRFWCLAKNDSGLLAAGHDDSFIIFKLKGPIIYDVIFWIKEGKIYNYRNEKVIDTKREVKILSSDEKVLIVNYQHRFEAYKLKDKKSFLSSTGTAVLSSEKIVC